MGPLSLIWLHIAMCKLKMRPRLEYQALTMGGQLT